MLLVRQGLSRAGWGGAGRWLGPWYPLPALPQDYVVLLPSAYYEAALLQLRVTEACTFRPTDQRSAEK